MSLMFYSATTSHSRTRRSGRTVGVCLALVALAACSGGGHPATSSTAPATTGSGPTTSPASSTDVPGSTTAPVRTIEPPLSAAAGLARAQARVAAFSNGPVSIGPTLPVTGRASGLSLAYVECPSPDCGAVGSALKSVALALGAKYTVVDHDGSAASVATAFGTAVAAHPNMILTSALPADRLVGPLAVAGAAHIPVISWELSAGPRPDGVAANVVTGDDLWFRGVLLADEAVAAGAGHADAVLWSVRDLVDQPGLGQIVQGFRDELATVCTACSVRAFDYTPAEVRAGKHLVDFIGADAADRGIDTVVSLVPDLLDGGHDSLNQVLQSIGAATAKSSDVRVISQAGGVATYQSITKQQQLADLAVSRSFIAWRAVDAGLRVLAGQDPVGAVAVSRSPLATFADHPDVGAYAVPMQVLTAASFTRAAVPVNSPWKSWPGVPGFDQVFRALWGTGKP